VSPKLNFCHSVSCVAKKIEGDRSTSDEDTIFSYRRLRLPGKLMTPAGRDNENHLAMRENPGLSRGTRQKSHSAGSGFQTHCRRCVRHAERGWSGAENRPVPAVSGGSAIRLHLTTYQVLVYA